MRHCSHLISIKGLPLPPNGAGSARQTCGESQRPHLLNWVPTGASPFPLTKETGGPRFGANTFVGNHLSVPPSAALFMSSFSCCPTTAQHIP